MWIFTQSIALHDLLVLRCPWYVSPGKGWSCFFNQSRNFQTSITCEEMFSLLAVCTSRCRRWRDSSQQWPGDTAWPRPQQEDCKTFAALHGQHRPHRSSSATDIYSQWSSFLWIHCALRSVWFGKEMSSTELMLLPYMQLYQYLAGMDASDWYQSQCWHSLLVFFVCTVFPLLAEGLALGSSHESNMISRSLLHQGNAHGRFTRHFTAVLFVNVEIGWAEARV